MAQPKSHFSEGSINTSRQNDSKSPEHNMTNTHTYIYMYKYISEGNLEVKLPAMTIWTNEKAEVRRVEKKREEK